jgi:hypothetical protein
MTAMSKSACAIGNSPVIPAEAGIQRLSIKYKWHKST